VTAAQPAPLVHAMPHTAAAALAGVLILATAVWAGGLVTIFVAARVAGRTLQPAERVAFFRGLGRAYLPAGGLALLVALASGAVLLYHRPWDGSVAAAAWLGAALLCATAAGVAQARSMTQLRRAAVRHPGDPVLARRVRRAARRAAALRMVIAALSVALIALGAWLAS